MQTLPKKVSWETRGYFLNNDMRTNFWKRSKLEAKEKFQNFAMAHPTTQRPLYHFSTGFVVEADYRTRVQLSSPITPAEREAAAHLALTVEMDPANTDIPAADILGVPPRSSKSAFIRFPKAHDLDGAGQPIGNPRVPDVFTPQTITNGMDVVQYLLNNHLPIEIAATEYKGPTSAQEYVEAREASEASLAYCLLRMHLKKHFIGTSSIDTAARRLERVKQESTQSVTKYSTVFQSVVDQLTDDEKLNLNLLKIFYDNLLSNIRNQLTTANNTPYVPPTAVTPDWLTRLRELDTLIQQAKGAETHCNC